MRAKYWFCAALLCCSGYSLTGQTIDRTAEIRAMMWENPLQEFSETVHPSKWDNEDAVTLAISQERAYRKPPLSTYLIEETSIHERAKVLTNAGLEEYGQFSFRKSSSLTSTKIETYVGFKIIKPDGREVVVDEKEAVKEDIEVNSSVSYTNMKLAIPNLEVGDIIDYYIYYRFRFPVAKFYPFDPAIFVLRKKYPTSYGRIKFSVLRRCYINLRTYNGAPSFEKSSADDEEDTYFLEYRDQEKIEPLPWFYPYRSLPTIKFKVTYASSAAAYQYPNLLDKANPGALNSEISKARINSYVGFYTGPLIDFTGLLKYMKLNFQKKKINDQETLVKEAFYHQRNKLAVQYEEIRNINGLPKSLRISPPRMVKNLSTYFKKAKIPHAYVIGVPKPVGQIEDLVVEEEVLLGLKVLSDPPIYFCAFNQHSLVNELDDSFDGNEVYISQDLTNPSIGKSLTKEQLPQSSHAENFTTYEIGLDLNIQEDSQLIGVTKTLGGMTRFDEQKELMDFYDYKIEEEQKFEMKPILEGLAGKRYKETLQKKQDYAKTRDKERNKALKELNESLFDFEIDTTHSFNLLQTGRQEDHPHFEYEYAFETKELVSKAGKNKLLSIGKLITSKLEIDKKYKENREFDIYLDYPKSYNFNITMDVPADLELQGIENLNVSIANSSAEFNSSASLQEGKLMVQVSHAYKTAFEPKENWSDLIEITEAVEKFSEAKLLFSSRD